MRIGPPLKSAVKLLLHRLDSPLLPLVLVAAATTVFILGMLSRNDFNASWFITAGDRFCDPTLVQNLLVRKNSDGFDGQFYYRLALDPFSLF